MSQPCRIPPPGWTCSREAGHPGPCAASPVAQQAAISPPTIPQLVRFKKRIGRALDHLENASFEALSALRAFDGDKLPLRFSAASAWETAHSAEAAIPALKSLMADALGDVEAQLKDLRHAKETKS